MTAIALSLLSSVLSGIILLVIKAGQKKAQSREADRDERERLILDSLNGLNCVQKELVECVLHNKTPNGELAEAFEYQQDRKHNLEEYARKKAAHS